MCEFSVMIRTNVHFTFLLIYETISEFVYLLPIFEELSIFLDNEFYKRW